MAQTKVLASQQNNEVTTDTNPGTLGGSRNYINLGGLKLAWGLTGGIATSSAGNSGTVTLPTSFFTTIASIQTTSSNMTVDARASIAVSAATTSTLTLTAWNPANAGTTQIRWFVIGT